MTKGKLYGSQDSDHAVVHLGLNVSSSAIIVGAWSMAVMLWQRFEYYIYVWLSGGCGWNLLVWLVGVFLI